jgi:hypothetical protein
VRLRSELTTKQHYTERLELLLRQRSEMIDALHGRIDQLRQHVKNCYAWPVAWDSHDEDAYRPIRTLLAGWLWRKLPVCGLGRPPTFG